MKPSIVGKLEQLSRRLAELEERRGIRLAPYKLLEPNAAIEHRETLSTMARQCPSR